MRRVLGCLVLLVASPAFGYLVDIRGAGDSSACLHLTPTSAAFTLQMYIDTQIANGTTVTSAESRIATVADSSGSIPVPDVLDIIGPDAIPVTNEKGVVIDTIYPQYTAPTWKNLSSDVGALPLPAGRCNAGFGHNWSQGRIGSRVNYWNGLPSMHYIYGRVLLATFSVKLKNGYAGPWSNDCQHPSFYIVATDSYVTSPVYYPQGGQPGTQVADPGIKIAVCVTPEPATALLLLGAIPFLRSRR